MKQPDFIEKILLEKEYEHLTAAEKILVDEWIAGKEEYNILRGLLAGIQYTVSHDEPVQPSAPTAEKIKTAFAARQHRKPLHTLRYIVLGLSVAAAVLLFVTVWLNNDTSVPAPMAGDKKPTTTEPAPPVADNTPAQGAQPETPPAETDKTAPPEIVLGPENTYPEPDTEEKGQSISMAENEDLLALTVTVF